MTDARIVERLFRKTYVDGRVRLEDAVAALASDILGCDRIEAEAYANRRKVSIWARVLKGREDELGKGLQPTFEVLDMIRLELRWHPAAAPGDDAETIELKNRLACRGELLDYIDSEEVNWRQYEALGCVICKLAGAEQWGLTTPGNDWNIDFLALVPAHSQVHLLPSVGHQIRIVGQSKKWATAVPRSAIQLLAGTVGAIRMRSDSVLQLLPPWFIASRGPLIGVMVAHKGVNRGGEDYAASQGLVVADSRDIVEIACLSRSWRAELGASEAIACLTDSIEGVLASVEETAG